MTSTTIQHALIALPARVGTDLSMWPVGASIITGTDEVTNEIDALGDTDPEEHNIPPQSGLPMKACMIVWSGTISEKGWVGTMRLADERELHALQNGHLLAHWHWLDEEAKRVSENQEALAP